MNFMCIPCSAEQETIQFPTIKLLQEHNKAVHSDKSDSSETPPELAAMVEKNPDLKPIELEYKFRGACAVCGREVDTLILEVEKTLVAIAYCGNCKKDRKQVKVLPIEKQFEKK